MKGVIFTEFIEFIEDNYTSIDMDHILDILDLESDGAYTAVGQYPFDELLAIIQEIIKITNKELDDIIMEYSVHLFNFFATEYGHLIIDYKSTREVMKHLDDVIHPEVKKFYPDVIVPTFEYKNIDEYSFKMNYKSQLPLNKLSFGLMQECIKHFNDDIKISEVYVRNETNYTQAEFLFEQKNHDHN